MNYSIIFLTWICLLGSLTSSFAQCLEEALCQRKYNEVVIVMTHNAYNYEGGFTFPNQTYDIPTQLADGVRGLMIDAYMQDNDDILVYHTLSALGTEPFAKNLTEIKTFLDENPTEFITVIMENHGIPVPRLLQAFEEVGLDQYLYHHTTNEWPTLAELMAIDQRFIFFSEQNDGSGEDWYLYIWDHAFDTHFSVESRADINCDLNRGNTDNSLYLLNNFITDNLIGVGEPDSAALINDYDFLLNRMIDCWETHNKVPNFIGIDFHEKGNAFAVADFFNAFVTNTSSHEIPQQVTIYPNPSAQGFHLPANWPAEQEMQFSLYNLQGKLVYQSTNTFAAGLYFEEILPRGLYFYELTDTKEFKTYAQGKFIQE